MPRLTNDELAALAREYNAEKATEAAAKARKQDLGRQIVTELNRRKKDRLEVDGVRITKKASTTTTYSVDRLKATLKRRAGRFLKVDGRALADAVKAGDITAAEKAACIESSSPGSAYPDITELVS